MPVAVAMTVEEFRRLPECGAHILELRNGEVIKVTRPKKRHDDRVYAIRRLLPQDIHEVGYLKEEFSFRPLPEFELRVADLAFVPWGRWDQVEDDDNLHGSPEFIVEGASPSNSAEEMQEKKDLCLRTGCLEFWVVYPKLRQIDVSTRQDTRTYRAGDRIPLTVFPGHEIGVDGVFAAHRKSSIDKGELG